MTATHVPIPDLSESAQVETRADLLAGSAGYQHFLQQLSSYISPDEARQAYRRFRMASRAFWLTAVAFAVLYVVVNQLLGPRSLTASAWGNDFLRASLLLAAFTLSQKLKISVAGQMLLPLAALTFLPMPVAPEENWAQGPLIFAVTLFALFAVGWGMDAPAEEHRKPYARIIGRWLLRAALAFFIGFNLVAWKWIVDSSAPPVLSILAAVAVLLVFELSGRQAAPTGDVEFLYAAAWKRWRFLITGRAQAIVLGIIPFLLFANLLDYQEQLERAQEVDKAPEILRMNDKAGKWTAFYWRQEGRFLEVTDFAPPREDAPVVQRFYLLAATTPTDPDSPDLPKEFRGNGTGAEAPINIPANLDSKAIKNQMLALSARTMTREEFDDLTSSFAPLQITSRERLLRRTTHPLDLVSGEGCMVISYQKTGPATGICFVQMPELRSSGPERLEQLVTRYSFPKWIFFGFGILGFIFLWRRGGDSSLARWLGVWLIGISLIPSLNASEDALPHVTHWLWQQSATYHWNTLASTAQPLFWVFYLAATTAALLWMMQISPAVCWAYICWPTKIYPKYPAIVRQLIIIGKLAVVVAANILIFLITVLPVKAMSHIDSSLFEFVLFQSVAFSAFLISGAVVRRFTSRGSEVPHLGFWPVLAVIALDLTLLFYAPGLLMISEDSPSPFYFNMGAFFGCLFIAILGFMILKRDFLRVRAISGFTMLLLLIIVPLVVHAVEELIPTLLTSGPFFRERGAEMVSVMLVVLLFPWLHHLLHEVLLAISVPRLRHIEHRVEHALEEIVDAEDDHARAHMVSELFEQLRVPHYLFLSRRLRGTFTADINKLSKEVPPTLELSEQLRHFLGRRHHFVDLQCMAFEWPFFFHQFELYRMAQITGCRYLLPICVGESIRGLLLLPDGPGGTVIANPAVSENINNLGLAAAIVPNRPSQ